MCVEANSPPWKAHLRLSSVRGTDEFGGFGDFDDVGGDLDDELMDQFDDFDDGNERDQTASEVCPGMPLFSTKHNPAKPAPAPVHV